VNATIAVAFSRQECRFGTAGLENIGFRLSLRSPFAIFVRSKIENHA
jgi:hypothetical protein